MKSGCTTPTALPSNDTSRSKAKPTRTIPRMKPTSKIEKALICWIRFGVLVLFAISGMNNVVSVWHARPKSPASRDGACTPASPASWVVRPVSRTASYFIPSAMTGSTACVFLYPNRVSLTEAFEVLEPDDGKLSCPVLRGLGDRKVVQLLGSLPARPGHSRDTAVTETT